MNLLEQRQIKRLNASSTNVIFTVESPTTGQP
jgi:hypothetical protein